MNEKVFFWNIETAKHWNCVIQPLGEEGSVEFREHVKNAYSLETFRNEIIWRKKCFNKFCKGLKLEHFLYIFFNINLFKYFSFTTKVFFFQNHPFHTFLVSKPYIFILSPSIVQYKFFFSQNWPEPHKARKPTTKNSTKYGRHSIKGVFF